MNIKFPLVVVGAQWGDEGKGKVVDILSSRADYIVRYNGGNNAGHTVVYRGEKYKLSLVPSGALHKKRLFLAQGVVIDPKVLLKEIGFFEERGNHLKLTIDPRVNIVMPYHKLLDAATEAWKGKRATGSLHLGIGYCYEDKNNRAGVRFEDLIDPKLLKEKIETMTPLKKRYIEGVFGQKANLNPKEILKEYSTYGRKLKKYLGDVSSLIQKECTPRVQSKGKKVLFEGAHGTFLDGIFGTFPFTTAVYTIAGGIFTYVGIAPQKVYSLGIVKAYTTRVGNGPFPTELANKIGDEVRTRGNEFGTVSKRPRRCGWLDLPLIKTATRFSGFNYIALTKLDVLSTLKTIKIGVGYTVGGRIIDQVPALTADFYRCKPIYKELKGWEKDISRARRVSDLPKEARVYLEFIEKYLKVPIKFIFVGPDREETIEMA